MVPRFLVTHSGTGDEFEFGVSGPETRIGRAHDQNDLVLNDHKVSRRHAILRQSGHSFLLSDLKSGNGTLVNGKRITERLLSDGDVVTIGDFLLTFYGPEETVTIRFDDHPLGNTLMLRTPDSIVPGFAQGNKLPGSPLEPALHETPDNLETLRRKAETLTHLYELSRVLSSVFSLAEIFKRVSKMLFSLTPSDRFIVLLKDPQGGELSPFVSEFREQGPPLSVERAPISRTVLNRVLTERVSLLSLDAQADERLALAASILAQQIRSVMCAPLLGKSSVLGAIYLDCQQRTKMFSTEDLDLLNALAVETSMAVDNAITHEQLLKEAVARAAYGRFMPRHVVDEILANPDALSLGGNNQLVTVLFSDVRGFTALSGDLPPQTVVQLLNRYFTEMTPVIFENRGLLDKFMGDGLMALFGVPYQSQDSAVNAVSAAIAMQQRVSQLNEDLKKEGYPEIEIGVGINTGIVTIGYIGSEQRTDYTAIGDAVNLASRFEKLAQPRQILIGQSTLEAIGDRFPIKAYGETRVKGKNEPVPVYEVTWKDMRE
ncbi:MAG TPA: adenylate/guanylate cyclase domain-containing protein [Terriglobia bacterium]|nr:adenylate/guanylate cyclase domain-containing protein [Terriglobia bacterium]